MNLTNIQLGSNVAPGGSAFTVNRYVNAAAFKLVINGTGTDIFELTTGVAGATRRFAFASSGQYTMDAYGAGTFTGTATKWLAVTAAGVVIEEDPPTGGGGSGTVNTGIAPRAAYYPVTGDAVDDWIGVEFGNPNVNTKIISQATTDVQLEINLAVSQTADAFVVKNSGGTPITQITKDGYGWFPAGGSGANAQGLKVGGTGLFEISNNLGIYGSGTGFNAFIGGGGIGLKNNTAAIDWGQQSTFAIVNNARLIAITQGHLRFQTIASTAAVIFDIRAGEDTSATLRLSADEADDATDTWDLTSTTANNLTFTNNSNIRFSLATSGQLTLGAYGVGAFTGTETYLIATDASGNLIEFPSGGLPGGGTLITADEGLTMSTATNVQLFGPLATPATLTTDRYLTAGSNTLNITADTLAGAAAFKITSTSTAAASSLQRGIVVNLSGANSNSGQTTACIDVANTHTGTSSVNYGIAASATGGATNYGVAGFTTSTSGNLSAGVRAENTSTGYGLLARSTGVGTAVQAETTGSGYGVNGQTATGVGVRGVATGSGRGGEFQNVSLTEPSLLSLTTGSTTNDIINVAEFSRETSGTAADGMGGFLRLAIETTTNSRVTANEIKWHWTTAANATRTSTLTLTGVLSATTVDLLVLAANGSVKWRPITATAASAITPAEGMIVFTSDTDATFTAIGFWGYENGAWNKL